MKHSMSLLAAALMTFLLCGCANTASQQQHADVPPPDFDSEKVPAVTSNTHYAAGRLAEARGEDKAAESQYLESLKSDKKYPPSLYALGCLYAREKKYDQSLGMWHRYVEATNQSAFAYSNLAFTEELAGLPQKAEQDYQRGVARDPNNEPCRVNFGLMLARHGRVPEAIIQLQAVLDAAEVHFNIASVYELQNRPAMAKLEYKRALAVDPNFADAKEKLASLGGVESAD